MIEGYHFNISYLFFSSWDDEINAVECSGVLGSAVHFSISSAVEAYLLFTRTSKQHQPKPSCWRFGEEKRRKKERHDGGLCGISLSDTDL